MKDINEKSTTMNKLLLGLILQYFCAQAVPIGGWLL